MGRMELTGQVFGRLTALNEAGRDKHGKVLWLCLCRCGKQTEVSTGSLRKGATQSCGCLHRELLTDRNKANIAGQRFGRLLAVNAHEIDGNRVKWHCQCDCGSTAIVQASHLISGNTKSCGCLKAEATSKRKKINIEGERFGRLVAISEEGQDIHNNITWLCRCDCGNTVKVAGTDLRKGHTKSCGCLSIDKTRERSTTHGGASSRIYKIWQNMRSRCSNPRATRYEEYGGRGITVCADWKDNFELFRDWAMASGYADTLTIERKDANGNYSPDNCTWIPLAEQSMNTRSQKFVKIDGVTKLQKEWLRHFGISGTKYYEALKAGVSRKDAILMLKDRVKRKSKNPI